MNLPGVKVALPVLQEKDKNDLVQFGIPQGVDFVAASFVQSADDVKLIRETLGPQGRNIKIISKIENEAGLKNFDEILVETDGIMVARGDLGMEIPPEKVFLAQKMMIAKCNRAGKPVVTATQMLESMVKMPRPTRAEASDVANAVLDGTDVVMLSGETAGGEFPVNAVTIMRRVCEEAESVIDYGGLSMSIGGKTVGTVEAVCAAAVKTAADANCKVILALTETGNTAMLLCKYRPSATIVAITVSEQVARQLNVCRGVASIVTGSFQGMDSVIKKGVDKLKADGVLKDGDSIVAVHGQKEEMPAASNLLKVLTV
jgi:pyruvate kinase